MIASMALTRERVGWRDLVLALAVLAAAIVYGSLNVSDDEVNASVAVVPLFALAAVPLLWRRAAPLVAVAGIFAVFLANALAFPDVVRCGLAIPLAFLVAFAAGAHLEGRGSLLGIVGALGIGAIACVLDGPTGADAAALTFVAPITIAVWVVGGGVRSRGHLVRELTARTSELRDARDERARLEVATDRARLSAELDELLHRRLGELAKLADGGTRHQDPELAAATLAAIEHGSRTTLEEMRSVVGVLRGGDADAPVAPQPTLTHLDALLVRAKGAGARLEIEGNPRALPAGVELSAYRVVEHLLDALQDADDVEVRVRFADGALEIAVAGPARKRAEQAIERARERVRLHHGTLAATMSGGRAEAVASLPLFAVV